MPVDDIGEGGEGEALEAVGRRPGLAVMLMRGGGAARLLGRRLPLAAAPWSWPGVAGAFESLGLQDQRHGGEGLQGRHDEAGKQARRSPR